MGMATKLKMERVNNNETVNFRTAFILHIIFSVCERY